MSEVIQIKEFEAITCEVDDKIEYGVRRLSKPHFDELVMFAKEYTSDNQTADALEFMKLGYKRNVGDVITFNNYVGMIQTSSGLKVEVLPKIDLGTEQDDVRETKRIFLKMLKTMRDFEGKTFSNANMNVDRMNLYEIFINMYLQEVRQLVKKGLKSGYVGREENLNYYKGKMLTSKHLRTNMVHRERFYVSYDEFHPNRVENKLIKATLLKLQKLTKSAENTKEIYKLLSFFEMVEPSVNYQKDFSKVVIDRSTKNYELLMQWSKVFLMNQSFTTFSGQQQSRAILFPMESVYESYVAYMLKKVMLPLGWNVSSQDKGYYLFEEPHKQFALRPDIVLNRGNRCIVLDTKWKALSEKKGYSYGISQADMYQMFAYSKKYMTSEIWLLYPMTNEFREHEDIWFRSGTNESPLTNVNVFFVDLATDDCFELLGQKIEEQSLFERTI